MRTMSPISIVSRTTIAKKCRRPRRNAPNVATARIVGHVAEVVAAGAAGGTEAEVVAAVTTVAAADMVATGVTADRAAELASRSGILDNLHQAATQCRGFLLLFREYHGRESARRADCAPRP